MTQILKVRPMRNPGPWLNARELVTGGTRYELWQFPLSDEWTAAQSIDATAECRRGCFSDETPNGAMVKAQFPEEVIRAFEEAK